ncbi:MAG: flagellar hook capping FlgD N-terminal domain-containing protein [Kiritimatiellia bacterium]
MEAVSANASLDQDAYLKLMITQLQHQDPMDPLKNKEFITQMAQMSQVESVNKMANLMEGITTYNQLSSAVSMIGRTVDYGVETDEQLHTGVVDLVSRKDGKTLLDINGEQIPADRIITVH